LDLSSWAQSALHRVAAWPTHTKVLLALACTLVAVELVLRRVAPRSAAYKRWTAGIEAIGHVWTTVILSIIYILSVGPVSLVTRFILRDPLDRALVPEPSFWRSHEPNPLGARAAARHQF
jgi:hypothetical protein